MESIKAPETIKIYQLIKQIGLTFSNCGTCANGLGIGFYSTQVEAEFARTMEILKDTTSGSQHQWHLFEIDVKNPAYRE